MAYSTQYQIEHNVKPQAVIFIKAEFGIDPHHHSLMYNVAECEWRGAGEDPYKLAPWEKENRPDLYNVKMHYKQQSSEIVEFKRTGGVTTALDSSGTFYTNSQKEYLDMQRQIEARQFGFQTHEEAAWEKTQREMSSVQDIDGMSIKQLKYINPYTHGNILPPEYVTALGQLTKALEREPQPAFINSHTDTRLVDITGHSMNDYTQNQNVWFDYFNNIIAKYEHGMGLAQHQWRELAENAQITTGDLVNGITLQVRDAQKNVLATVQGVQSFSYDKQTGLCNIGTKEYTLCGTDIEKQSRNYNTPQLDR